MTDVVDVLKTMMDKYGVKRVVIIDDSFELEFDGFVSDETWADFCSAIDQNNDIRTELEGIGITTETKSLDMLESLMDQQESLTVSMDAAANLLTEYEPRMQPLKRLQRLLSQCDISVVSRRPAEGVADDDQFDIAFIDFFLDDDDHPISEDDINEDFLNRASVRRSRDLAVEVFKKTNAFIVLMSSFLSVKRVEDAFQQSTEFLLKGFFKLAPKSELDDDASIAERLIRLPLDAELRSTVRKFAVTLEERFAEAATGASKTIRDLSIQDYAYLCNLVLRKESHPLGDYLVRMVASHLVAKLSEGELESCKRELDKLFRQHHFPLQEVPTTAFANLYSSHTCERLSDPGDGWTKHPMFGPNEAGLPLATLPYLRFGDMLIVDADSDVYLVLNAGCDLMFGPERTSRDENDSVILVPGSPRRLHDPVDTDRTPSAITWLIIIGEEQRRIEWDFRRVTTIPHKEVEKYREKGYKKNYRLGAVEAISIQQALLSHIGRVGTQTPPLIASWHHCRVYCKGPEGRPVQVGEEVPQMLVGIHRRSSPNDIADHLTMPDSARRKLADLLRIWIEQQRQVLLQAEKPQKPVVGEDEDEESIKRKQKEYEDAQKQIERREKWLANMEEMLKRWQLHFDLDDVQPFPGGRSSGSATNTERTVLQDIEVVTGVETDKKWDGQHFVILELLGAQR